MLLSTQYRGCYTIFSVYSLIIIDIGTVKYTLITPMCYLYYVLSSCFVSYLYNTRYNVSSYLCLSFPSCMFYLLYFFYFSLSPTSTFFFYSQYLYIEEVLLDSTEDKILLMTCVFFNILKM